MSSTLSPRAECSDSITHQKKGHVACGTHPVLLSSFKHNVKMHYLTWITNNFFRWICASVFMYMFRCCGCVYICICVYISVFSYLVLFILKLSFLLLLFLEFTPFSHFCSDLRDHNKNKAFLPILHYLSQCSCYSYLSAAIFQLQFLYFTF